MCDSFVRILVAANYRLYIPYYLAHMWFDDTIHGANTDEDPSNPEKTRRVILT